MIASKNQLIIKHYFLSSNAFKTEENEDLKNVYIVLLSQTAFLPKGISFISFSQMSIN